MVFNGLDDTRPTQQAFVSPSPDSGPETAPVAPPPVAGDSGTPSAGQSQATGPLEAFRLLLDRLGGLLHPDDVQAIKDKLEGR